MPTIFPTWPPADPTQPLPFDQRGCCGPVDQCGRHQKIQLRYEVRGQRTSGPPIGLLWSYVGTGFLVIADKTQWTWYTARSLSEPPIGSSIDLTITPGQYYNLPMFADLVMSLQLAVPAIVRGHLDDLHGYCSGQITFPCEVIGGPPDPPQEILVHPLRWFETSAYPYLGP